MARIDSSSVVRHIEQEGRSGTALFTRACMPSFGDFAAPRDLWTALGMVTYGNLYSDPPPPPPPMPSTLVFFRVDLLRAYDAGFFCHAANRPDAEVLPPFGYPIVPLLYIVSAWQSCLSPAQHDADRWPGW